MKNEKGFTLLEMLLVMVIISVLLLIVVPNIVQQRQIVQSKGCEALKRSIEAQVEAYQLNKGVIPTITELDDEDYITTNKCPDGKTTLTVDADGNVKEETAS